MTLFPPGEAPTYFWAASVIGRAGEEDGHDGACGSEGGLRTLGPVRCATRPELLHFLVDGAFRTLLAWFLHLPPSAVPLVSDVRFRRSA